MNADLIRIVDGIARDKNIDKESVFFDLEQAMISAVRKAYGQVDEVDVQIDRITGQISATRDGVEIEMRELGRIAAQTAKQVMIQKIREAERGSIFDEFMDRRGTIVTGTVSRFEGGALVVNLGRAEGFLPRSEQIPGESQHPGERVRCLILDVRESPRQVKIVLSRSHPDFIRRLFELEVPEVSERIIEIKALAREAGYRTKIAVSSIDAKVDAVGACVGVRGSRIRNIVVELGGEKIDIVRWNESSQILIGNALKPAEVAETALCFELGRATVVVPEDQLSLAIGKRGQNVRLAARLTGWDIDILTPTEYNKGLDDMDRVLSSVEGVDSDSVAKMSAMGMISLSDLEEVGIDPLVSDVGLDEAVAQRVLEVAGEEVRRQAEEKERIEKETAAQAEAAGPAVAEGESAPAAEASASATEEEGVTGGIEALLQKPAAESEEGVPAVEAESSEIGEMTAPTETPDESDAAPDAETEMREVVAESLSAMTEAAGPVEGEIAPEEEIAAEAQDKATEPGIAEGAEAEAPAPPGEPTSEEEPAATSSAEEEQREGGA